MSYYKVGREVLVGSTLVPGLTTTVGDREDAVRQLHVDFVQLRSDLYSAMGWRQNKPTIDDNNPIWVWYQANIKPTMDEWQRFHDSQMGSWYEKFRTDWERYVDWQKRLTRLREVARAKLAEFNSKLESPEPVGLPESPWRKIGDVGDSVGSTLKTIAYIGLGIGGMVIASNLVKK